MSCAKSSFSFVLDEWWPTGTDALSTHRKTQKKQTNFWLRFTILFRFGPFGHQLRAVERRKTDSGFGWIS